MTKPKNMTPDQEAVWLQKDRARRSTPEYKAKAAIRARRWYDKPGNKEMIVERTRVARQEDGGRERRNAAERERLRNNADLRARENERVAEYQKTEHGRKKGAERSRRYSQRKTVDRQYDRFLANLAAETIINQVEP